MKFLLAAFFICAFFAVSCGDSPSQYRANQSTVDWFPKAPLTDKEIRSASCLPPKNFFKSQIEATYQPLSQEIFQQYSRSLVPHCFPDCKIEDELGAEESRRMLYLLDMFGVNTSPYQLLPPEVGEASFQIKNFNLAELELIIRVLHSMPPSFYSSVPFLRVKKLSRGTYAAVSQYYNFTVLRLSDLWSLQSEEFKMYILMHELAHTLDMDLPVLNEWRKISGWPTATPDLLEESKRVYSEADIDRPQTLVTPYAHFNPFEDFAEAAAFYRFAPAQLKAVSPEKYKIIQYQVFQGLEFGSDVDCGRLSVCQMAAETDPIFLALENLKILDAYFPEFLSKNVVKSCSENNISFSVMLKAKSQSNAQAKN